MSTRATDSFLQAELFHAIIENCQDAILIFSEDDWLVYCNQKARQQLSLNENQIDKTDEVLPSALNAVVKQHRQDTSGLRHADVCIEGINQEKRWFEAITQRVCLGNQEFLKLSIRDISPRKAKESSLEREAYTDDLSGLSNRRQFREVLDCENESAIGLGFIDVDHFKSINDRYGHAKGDSAIRWVAAKLLEFFGTESCVARLGGEEFGVVLDASDRERAVQLLDAFRQSIQDEPFLAGDRITVSIGLAFAEPAKSPQSLFEEADQALYCSKNDGRNRITVFGPEDFVRSHIDS